jgi:hypothetical protein
MHLETEAGFLCLVFILNVGKPQSTSQLHIHFTDYPGFPIIREINFPFNPDNWESTVFLRLTKMAAINQNAQSRIPEDQDLYTRICCHGNHKFRNISADERYEQ